MPLLMSEEATTHLMSFSAGKKIAFLVLLYERMIPELRSFCLTEGRDFSVFQKARKEFWQWLMGGDSSISWGQFRKVSCTRFRRHRVRCFMEQEVCHGETAVYAGVQA